MKASQQGESQRATLAVLSAAVSLSVEFVASRPHDLASQMAGRLTGLDDLGVAKILAAAEKAAPRPGFFPLSAALDGAGSELERVFAGHHGGVMLVAVTPDGKQIVSGGADNTVRIWDLERGHLLRTLKAHGDTYGGVHTHGVLALAVSPDGRRIVSGGRDRHVRVWDLSSGRLERERSYEGEIGAAVITPDGARLVTVTSVQPTAGNPNRPRSSSIVVTDLETGGMVSAHSSPVGTLFGAPIVLADGKHMLLPFWDHSRREGGVHVLDIESASVLRALDLPGVCAVSPDGSFAVASTSENPLRVWDLRRPRPKEVMTVSARSTRSPNMGWRTVISPTGDIAIVTTPDNSVCVWDFKKGRLQRTLTGHAEAVNSIAFSPDGARVIAGGGDSTIRMWDIRRAENKSDRGLSARSANAVAAAPTGAWVASADGKMLGTADQTRDTIRFWGIPNGRALREIDLGESPEMHLLNPTRVNSKTGVRKWLQLTCIAVTRDGSRILAGGLDGRVGVWDVKTGRFLRSMYHKLNSVRGLVVVPHEDRVVVADELALRIWDIESGELWITLAVGKKNFAKAVAISGDGSHLASSEGNSIQVWDLLSCTDDIRKRDKFEAMFIDPPYPPFVSGLRIARTLAVPGESVSALALTADARSVYSGGDDGVVRAWDVATGHESFAFEGHTGPVVSLAIAAGGQRLFSVSKDNTLRAWDTTAVLEVARWEPDPGETITSCCTVPSEPSLVAYGGSRRGVQILRLLDHHTNSSEDVVQVLPQGSVPPSTQEVT